MTRIAALTLMMAALCAPAMTQQVAEFSSYYSGNRYDFRLTQKQLLNTPVWREDEPNPPVSPRTAQDAARTYLRTFKRAMDLRSPLRHPHHPTSPII